MLRGPVLTHAQVLQIEASERAVTRANVRAGRPRFRASLPAVRASGPLLPVLGGSVGYLNPLGPNRRILAP